MKLIMLGVLASITIASVLGFTYTQYDQPAMLSAQNDHIPDALELIMPQAFAETTCDSIDTTGRNVVELNLTGESVELPIIGGKTYKAMTFSEQVPGPTVRVTQGDIIKMRLEIPSDEITGHSNDMHASQISSQNFKAVFPGQTSEYCYIAEAAGVFKYHCAGIDLADMERHVLSGMYGIAIVDPLKGYKKLMVEKTVVGDNGEIEMDRTFYDPEALEFQLQYTQLYLDDDGNFDRQAMFDHENTATVVNGMQFAYVPNMAHNLLVNGDADDNIFIAQPWNGLENKQFQSQLLFVEQGQHVRLFIENIGNEPVFFHIVGEILDRVTQGGRIQSGPTETWTLGGSQNMIVDVVFDEPGTYAAVNHDYAAIYTGAATVFVVGDPFDLNPTLVDAGVIEAPVPSYAYVMGNPSSAVPPMGPQSIPHPAVNIHGLMTDNVAEEMKASGDYIALWEVIPQVAELLS